jgi:hypothetical protein
MRRTAKDPGVGPSAAVVMAAADTHRVFHVAGDALVSATAAPGTSSRRPRLKDPPRERWPASEDAVTVPVDVLPAAIRAGVRTLWEYHDLGYPLRRCDVGVGLGSHDLNVATFTAELFHRGMQPAVLRSAHLDGLAAGQGARPGG